MEKDHLEIILEDIQEKFELVLEGHTGLRHEIKDMRQEMNEKFELVDFKIDALNTKIDGVEKRLDAKIERAKKPETMLVTRNAMDTNDLVFLINAFDFQFRAMRDRVGIKGSNVTLEVFQVQIDKTNALKDQIHLHNKELSAITGLKYRAPRGFE